MSGRVPARPHDADPHVRVRVGEWTYAVWFVGGAPFWAAAASRNGWLETGYPIAFADPHGRYAAAAREAEAFLAQHRLPAVAA